MIENGVEVIKTALNSAIGDGKFITLYLITVIVAFMYIKDKNNRALLINYVIVIVLIIFNPVVANILNKFLDGGVYWRLFWCMPLGITVAYIFTEMIFNNENKYKKIVVSIALIGVIIFSGEITYREDIFYDTDTWLKLPDEHVEIVYMILQDVGAEKESVMLFSPPEINAHVRQITSKIRLNYERDAHNSPYSWHKVLQDFSNMEFSNGLKKIKELKCDYVIWTKQENFSNSFEGVTLLLETSNYFLYRIDYK